MHKIKANQAFYLFPYNPNPKPYRHYKSTKPYNFQTTQ